MIDKKQWQAEQAQFNDTSRYNDIMNVPRHVSRAHLPMTKRDRAGQFAPFAALTGYRELLDKIAQRYANKKYPTGKEEQVIFDFFHHLPSTDGVALALTYFNGESGYYDHYQGTLTRVDWAQQVAHFEDGRQIPLLNIRAVTRKEEKNGEG
ncbi:hypothetical protein [Limosilactobacillus sp.]|uniref:hypothetical protein n=1 Tax=Limosilactobacillus sp. TaxID=2773925 RepID=UPI003F0E6143